MTECPVTTFTVTTAGLAWTRWPSVPGEYSLTDEEEFNGLMEHNGQAMLWKTDGTLNAFGHLYSVRKGFKKRAIRKNWARKNGYKVIKI